MHSNSPEFGERADFGGSDTCYRHPDRGTFTLCHRCGRNICGDCQLATPVGVICPDCAHAAQVRVQETAKANRGGFAARLIADKQQPVVTYSILGLSLVIFLAQMLVGGVTQALWYAPVYSLPEQFEPWRMITSIFTHSTASLFHILFNMYALWLFGRQLEAVVGRLNFLLLYLLSGLGGSLAVLLWGYTSVDALRTPTVGASGAIFGVLGATIVVMKAANINTRSLLILIAINLVIGFMPGVNISWQAHLGGLIVGLLAMVVMTRFRGPRNKTALYFSVAGIALVLVLLSFAYFVVNPLTIFFG